MERRLAAILAADVVGYSRLMGTNEVGTLQALKAHRTELIDREIAQCNGRVFKLMGDGMLIEFSSVVSAVDCATRVQRQMRLRNAEVPDDRRIEFRMGINLGDVIVENDDLFGDGINVAARIESIAQPGGISVSASVRDNIGNKLDLNFEDRGVQVLKNIERPVRVYDIDLTEASQVHAAVRLIPNVAKRPSIAVLPFNNMSNDPDQEYFSDGITEDIITDLSKISGLFVIGRNTSFTYKGRSVQLQETASELGVRFLLEGSVRKAGQRVRVTGQLIDGATGGHIWADRFDRDLTDIFAIQDEITKAIVEQLRIMLLPEEKAAIEHTPTDNFEAYNCYLRGRQFYQMLSRQFLSMALQMFTRAVELDPDYALAYVGLANCHSRLTAWHGEPVTDETMILAEKALALQPDLAEAHAARGSALAHVGKRQLAAAAFEQALALDPNSHDVQYGYARFLATERALEPAAAHLIRSLEISPDDYRSPLLLANMLLALGRRDEAEKYLALGVRRAEEATRHNPESSNPAQMAACALAGLGHFEEARQWLRRSLAIDPDDNIARYNAACTYALLGDHDQAIDMLETCLPNMGGDTRMWFRNDSDLDAIRDHPRYAQLLG